MSKIRWLAEIPDPEVVMILHNGDDKPKLFKSAEAAFAAGQSMDGVDDGGCAFIVRRASNADLDEEDDKRYGTLLDPDEEKNEHYPVWVGQNGAKWVREWYRQILMEIVQQPNWKLVDMYLDFIPDHDPDKEQLVTMLQTYRERDA